MEMTQVSTDTLPPLAALVTAGSVLLLAAVAIVAAGAYLLGCRIWPYTNCTRCNGTGKSTAPTPVSASRRRAFRDCPRCQGTGRRTRIGRRLLDHHTNH
jgi:hypothetical protein